MPFPIHFFLNAIRKSIFTCSFSGLPLCRCAVSTIVGRVGLKWGTSHLQRQHWKARASKWRRNGEICQKYFCPFRTAPIPHSNEFHRSTAAFRKKKSRKKNCSHIVITSEFKYFGDGHGVAAKQNRRTPDNFNSRALWLWSLYLWCLPTSSPRLRLYTNTASGCGWIHSLCSFKN